MGRAVTAKSKSVPITANAVTMVTQSGDAKAAVTLGVNLPNDDQVRSEDGSKNIMISNALESTSGYFLGSKEAQEFSLDEAGGRAHPGEKWGAERPACVHVAPHETVGHASGKLSKQAYGAPQPSEFLKEYSDALEEARAELFGLWAIGDAKLKSLGVVKNPR